jgi:hypothetical protein
MLLPEKIGPTRIVLYGRPSTPRNLFSTALRSLNYALSKYNKGTFEIISVGEKHEDVQLPCGFIVKSYGKLSPEAYLNLLAKSDIGLSLMLSPHPSYPPLEMALHGIRVITNKFENKQLKDIENLSAIEPYPENLSDELEVIYQKVKSTKKVIPTFDFLNKMGLPMEEVFENLINKLG